MTGHPCPFMLHSPAGLTYCWLAEASTRDLATGFDAAVDLLRMIARGRVLDTGDGVLVAVAPDTWDRLLAFRGGGS